MTGGGAGDIAWLHEPVDDYAGSPTDTDYKAVGIDAQLEDLTIENALQRLRNFSTEAKQSIETTFRGRSPSLERSPRTPAGCSITSSGRRRRSPAAVPTPTSGT